MSTPEFPDDHEFNDYEIRWLNWAAQTMLERDWHGTARDARFLSMLAERYRLEDETDPERSAAALAKTRRRIRIERAVVGCLVHGRAGYQIGFTDAFTGLLPVVDKVTVSELAGPLFWALGQPSDRLRDYLAITYAVAESDAEQLDRIRDRMEQDGHSED